MNDDLPPTPIKDWLHGLFAPSEDPDPQIQAETPAPSGAWPPARLALALQGGGSFGAFTWGVLDRLLEDGRVSFDTVSGASAGAINGALLASGLAGGDRAAARELLERFWRRASTLASFLSFAKLAIPSAGIGVWLRNLAPQQTNPFDLNPLRNILQEEVDFAALKNSPVRLLVSTTRVRDGRLRIFRNAEIETDHLLASACLPMIHPTVHIDGEAYWDGGYVANPPLMHLVREARSPDVLVVRLTPSRIDDVPSTQRAIARRLDEIAFNAPLETELSALEAMAWRSRTEWREDAPSLRRLRELRLHTIAAEDSVEDLARANASDLDWAFLTRLRDAGRDAAEDWLAGGGASDAAPTRSAP